MISSEASVQLQHVESGVWLHVDAIEEEQGAPGSDWIYGPKTEAIPVKTSWEPHVQDTFKIRIARPDQITELLLSLDSLRHLKRYVGSIRAVEGPDDDTGGAVVLSQGPLVQRVLETLIAFTTHHPEGQFEVGKDPRQSGEEEAMSDVGDAE